MTTTDSGSTPESSDTSVVADPSTDGGPENTTPQGPTSTLVTLGGRPDFTPPPRLTTRDRARTVLDKAKLVKFLSALALKEHFFRDLHVRPLVAELFFTDNCNLSCVSCNVWRTHTTGELSTEEWYDVIDQLVDLGFIKLNFTGGEALVRRDVSKVIRYAHDAGIHDLHVNTNGILLTELRLAEILQAGIRSFNISIDAPTAEAHDVIRGRKGAFDLTVDAIRRIVARRDDFGLTVQVNFTVLSTNVHLLPAMADLVDDLDVELYLNLGTDTTFLFRNPEVSKLLDVDEEQLRTSLADLDRRSRAGNRRLPTPRDLAYIPGHFGFGKVNFVPCVESQLKLMVHSTGEVGGCWGHDPTLNLRNQSIRSIIDGAAYREEHARLFRKECVGCGSNYSLNLRVRPTGFVEAIQRRFT